MLFVLDFFDRDLFVLINQRWASPALDPMMIFLSSKWAFVPLYAVFIWLFWRKFGVANSFAVFSTAMMLLGLGRRWRLGLMYLASAIAYSRVYLGVHYVGDVFFGALLGLGIAYGLLWLYRNWLSPRMEHG